MTKSKPPYTIAILVNNIGYFVYTVCSGVSEATGKRGWSSIVLTMPPVAGDNTEIYDSTNFDIEDGNLISTLNQIDLLGIDGLVIHYDVADFASQQILKDYFSERPRLKGVSIGSKVPGVPLVVTDNYQSQYLAIEHLILEHHSQKILYIRGPVGNDEADQRFRGYQQCLLDHGITFDSELVLQGSFFMKSGTAAMKDCLANGDIKFDSIASANDNMLAGAISVLLENGFDVPGDFHVIGFDNNIYAQNFGFTTVEQSYEELSELAIQELEYQFSNQISPETRQEETLSKPGPLIIGNYCGCQGTVKRGKNIISSALSTDTNAKDNFINSFKDLRFNSKIQKVSFFQTLERFWELLNQFIETKDWSLPAIKSFRRGYTGLLQKLIILNSNLTPWQGIVKSLKQSCYQVFPEYSDGITVLFDQLEKATEDSVNRAFTQIRRTSEALGYEIMSLGHRLVGSESIDDIITSFSKFMGALKFDRAIFVLYSNPLTHIDNIECVNFISIFDEKHGRQKIETKADISRDDLFILQNEIFRLNDIERVYNLIMLPIAIKQEYFGYCLAEISSDSEHWPLYRSMQIYLSQALYNIEKLKQLKESEEKYKTASRAKTHFLSRMTHELRTPMNGVIGMTSLLLDTNLSPDQEDYISTIRNSGDTMLGLISEILDYSKIESDKLELEASDFNLATVIEEAFDLVSSAAGEKQLQLNSFISGDVPEIISQDGSRVRQVVLNLLSNAVKFTQSGFVNLTVHVLDSYEGRLSLEVVVKDSGIGIKEGQTSNLFKPFVQADANTHKQYGGTGLGLAISKTIAKKLNGDLQIKHSSSEGTAFSFTFEAEAISQNSYLWVDQKFLGKVKNNSYRVLVYSDSDIIRKSVKEACHYWGLNYIELNSFDGLSVYSIDDRCCLLVDEIKIDDLALDSYSGLDCHCLILAFQDGKKYSIPQNCQIVRRPLKMSTLFQYLNKLWRVEFNKPKLALSSEIDKDFAQKYPMSILLAEDNIVNQKVAVAILSKCGYRTDVVANGIEAVEAFKHRHYDIILMDILMPDMDGVAATQVIRNQFRSGVQPYVIALTANAQIGDREGLIKQGLNDYVSKPISVKKLLSALKRGFESNNQDTVSVI